MANSLESDGVDAVSLCRSILDSTLVPPHLQSSASLAAYASPNSTNQTTHSGFTKEKKQQELQVNCSEKCATETHVNEHALLTGEGDTFHGNDSKRNVKQRLHEENKPKRRGGKNRRNILQPYSHPIGKREKKGLMYSREELESLRFEDLEEQKKKWVEVYCGLGAMVVDEYDGLVGFNRARGKNSIPSFDFDPRSQLQKSADLFEICLSKVEGDDHEHFNGLDPPISDDIGSSVVEEGDYDDDDSDEEYSIQRPAFMVTGEPDFDSGPPQDGLEYLRRVRWEAARIPKVKVAKVNVVKEQSIYMPQIPDVMKCPDKLLPLKQWEDSFLSDFSQLREAFTRLELQECSAETSVEEDFLNKMLDNNTFEKLVSLESANDPFPSKAPCFKTIDAKSSPSSPDSSTPKVNRPTLSGILKMDSASRTSMLKKRINAVVDMDRLQYNDSLWLFALCATIDCPLHADTSAALRSLLRKCATLRAEKTEVDDEVITLNVLVTIAGRYFGQLERE